LKLESRRAEARDTLAMTGVEIPAVRARVLGMAGGQRQGVAIARAAGWGSRNIVLDAPTAALGVQETAKVEEIIRGLKRRGVAMLMISHNLRKVFELVDTVWVLRHGRMAGHVSVQDTIAEEVVAMFTGAHEATGTEFA